MPLRILFITHSINEDGGLGTPGISDQIAELEKLGLQIDIWKVRVSDKASYFKTAVKVFLLNFKKNKYDLIHATYSLNGLLARLQWRYPIILTLMGSDLMSREPLYKKGGRDALIGKFLSRLVDRVIVQTTEMADVVPCRKEIVHIVPYGINTDIFRPISFEAARQELGLPLSEKCILFPYNPARKEKGFPLVEQAVKILEKEIRVKLLVIYGQPRQVLAKSMNACDAMVLASDYEGSPVAVREAIACCLPIVSVRVGDVTEIISKIDGCHLCEHDPLDIANKLKLVFQQGTRIKIQENIISQNTAWSANEVMKIYDTL